jgi:hypothetical protein
MRLRADRNMAVCTAGVGEGDEDDDDHEDV